MSQPSDTNYPQAYRKTFSLEMQTKRFFSICSFICLLWRQYVKILGSAYFDKLSMKLRQLRWLQQWGSPLPIPNREVKPISADGTALRWESRSPPSSNPPYTPYRGFFYGLNLRMDEIWVSQTWVSGISYWAFNAIYIRLLCCVY